MENSKEEGSVSEKNIINVTTGILVETYCFNWKIENFEVVKSSPELLRKQMFIFEAGQSNGYPTKWQLEMRENFQWNTIEFGLRLLEAPPNSKPVAEFAIQDGKPPYVRKELKRYIVERGISMTLLPANEDSLKKMIWEDGSILLRVDFKLIIGKSAVVSKEETHQKLTVTYSL